MGTGTRSGTEGGVSRRGFLKSSAVGGAGLVAAPLVLKGGEDAAAPLNVALIGGGTQGRVLASQAIKIPGVHFQAVCDIWSYSQRYTSRRLRAYGHEAKVYEDWRDLLTEETDLQAAIVATPDWMHAEHTIACLEAGLPVYCEKEMSNDLAQARAMVLAARRTGNLLQIGHQRRSNPRYRHAKEKLLDEAALLGRITQVYGQWNRSKWASAPHGFPKNYPIDQGTLTKYGYESPFQFRNWRWFKKYGGGPICDLGSHQIDVFGWFLGARPISVWADGGADYWDRYEWHDNVYALYRFETPAGTVRALYETFSTTSARSFYESFMGDRGTLSISENPGQCRAYAEGGLPEVDKHHAWQRWVERGYLVEVPEKNKKKEKEPKTPAEKILAMYRTPPPVAFVFNVKVEKHLHLAHLENFFDAVRGRGELTCPAEVGYETAVQVLKVHEALASQAPVAFREEDYQV